MEVSTGPAVLAEIPSGLPAHGADSGVGTGEIATADRPTRKIRTPHGATYDRTGVSFDKLYYENKTVADRKSVV